MKKSHHSRKRSPTSSRKARASRRRQISYGPYQELGRLPLLSFFRSSPCSRTATVASPSSGLTTTTTRSMAASSADAASRSIAITATSTSATATSKGAGWWTFGMARNTAVPFGAPLRRARTLLSSGHRAWLRLRCRIATSAVGPTRKGRSCCRARPRWCSIASSAPRRVTRKEPACRPSACTAMDSACSAPATWRPARLGSLRVSTPGPRAAPVPVPRTRSGPAHGWR